MPELPEVETTVRGLRKKIAGLEFKDVWSDREKVVKKAGGINKLRKTIRGRKILSVSRRAKFIVIDIEGKYSLFIHQKISGHLLYGKWRLVNGRYQSVIKGSLRDDRENKYIRVLFSFTNGYQMAFCDLRRFGRIILVKDNEVDHLPEIKKLGPEPLGIKYKDFEILFGSKKGRIKQVLMDPFFIVGIGNIYADEILWSAGIHPLERVEKLESGELKKIYKNMVSILKKAINLRGSSFGDYRTPSGAKGSYQKTHHAYHRTGSKCDKKDGGKIVRIKLGGRSTHYCSKHQVLK